MTAALKSAQALLTKNKGFVPYGLVIDAAGALAPVKPARRRHRAAAILDSLYAWLGGPTTCAPCR